MTEGRTRTVSARPGLGHEPLPLRDVRLRLRHRHHVPQCREAAVGGGNLSAFLTIYLLAGGSSNQSNTPRVSYPSR